VIYLELGAAFAAGVCVGWLLLAVLVSRPLDEERLREVQADFWRNGLHR